MIYALLTLAFLLELVAFVSFACSSLLLPLGKPAQLVVGIILFLVLIVFWSRYMAPKASRKFSIRPYYAAKSIIYVTSAIVLFTKVTIVFGTAFVILALIDEVFLYKHNLSMGRDKEKYLKHRF